MVMTMNKYYESAHVGAYHGFTHYTFEYKGHEAHIILPHEPKEGAWIWRAEFLDCGFDAADIEMLKRGYMLAYYKVSDRYGDPVSVELMKGFYDLCTKELGYKMKTVLFGFSRGGLYSVNFALAYPEAVAALYLDAPVLDIKSWPGGLGTGLGDAGCWAQCLEIYGLDSSTALAFRGNPVDRLGELADLKLPVAVVAGAVDEDVPVSENCAHLERVYTERGLPLLYIMKPDCAHHPHSLEDATPICDFLERYL